MLPNWVRKEAHVRVWWLETGLGRLSCVWRLAPSVWLPWLGFTAKNKILDNV